MPAIVDRQQLLRLLEGSDIQLVEVLPPARVEDVMESGPTTVHPPKERS